jgi:hypothetical protein
MKLKKGDLVRPSRPGVGPSGARIGLITEVRRYTSTVYFKVHWFDCSSSSHNSLIYLEDEVIEVIGEAESEV